MKNKLRLFEMFAGFGGASFSLKKLRKQFECVGYSEVDKTAIKVFENNHKGVKNYGNCKEIIPEELPDFDLLTGGFPCQPFSVNTNKNARGENHKDFDLFESIIKIVSVKKPTYILLENVKGILGDQSKSVYNKIIRNLTELFYDVRVFVANSREYGIPQNRERVFFICKLGRWNEFFKFPDKEYLKLNIKDILEYTSERREPQIKNYKLSKKSNINKFGNISRFEAIIKSPVDKKNSNVAFEILDAPSNVVSRQSDRIYNTNYAPCLTATGKDYLFWINREVIVLTPKECFRLMGFLNDEIKFPKDINEVQKHKLAGNGWDINLVSKIFKEMFMEAKR